MAPLTGSQRVIDSPDSVSRVIPPTTIITKTRPATASSQLAIARGWVTAVLEGASMARAYGRSRRDCQSGNFNLHVILSRRARDLITATGRTIATCLQGF